MLPALTGSEKQVVWAEKIRTDILASIDQFFAKSYRDAEKAGKREELEQAMPTMFQPLIDNVKSQTSASWWIDRRGMTGRMVLLEVQAHA